MKYLRLFRKKTILEKNIFLSFMAMSNHRKEDDTMGYVEKIGDIITSNGKKAADKAKEIAEIASLRNQISACEEVIRKNYLEIGKLYMEQYKDDPDAPYEKQRKAILNAQAGVEDLQRKIREIKGL